jgi:hypothetical protein
MCVCEWSVVHYDFFVIKISEIFSGFFIWLRKIQEIKKSGGLQVLQ